MSPFFLLVAGLTLGGAVAAMSLRNPVHCALSLVVAFVGLAGTYLALGAQFLGLAQVLVYIGAVAILLVFVLLLTRTSGSESVPRGSEGWRSGLLAGVLVAILLIGVVVASPALPMRAGPTELPTVKDLGEALLTDFVLPLQVVGVLLTAALIGAAVIALHEPRRGPGTARRRGE